jgi:hypothetical protein
MPGSKLVNVSASLLFSKQHGIEIMIISLIFNKLPVAVAKSAKMPFFPATIF